MAASTRILFAVVIGAASLAAGAAVRAQQGVDPIGAALSGALPAAEPAPGKLRPAPPANDAEGDAAEPDKPAPAKPAEPLKRPRYAVAIIQALDKVTAETVRFEAPVGRPIRYKTLIFTVHACETTAPDEDQSDAAAHMEIDSQPNGPDGRPMPSARQVFKGWMFANSPGLNLFQHPVYDAWLIACKTAAPSA